MKNFFSTLKSLFSDEKPSVISIDPTTFDFIRSKKGILRELSLSRESGNVIGIYSNVLGPGMFLTAVETIENAEIVVVKQNDISGQMLSRTRIWIDEIQMVCPFNKAYRSPVVAITKKERERTPVIA